MLHVGDDREYLGIHRGCVLRQLMPRREHDRLLDLAKVRTYGTNQSSSGFCARAPFQRSSCLM